MGNRGRDGRMANFGHRANEDGGADLGPIICVTYTNHALDQLLEALFDNKVTSQIVRIGSRSKSERLDTFNLQNIAKDAEKIKMEKRSQWHSRASLEDREKDFIALG